MEILNATTFSPRNPIIHHPQSHVCSWTQVFDTMSGGFSPLAYLCLPRRRNMGWRFGARWMWRDLLVKCVASLISLLSQRHFRIGNSFQVLFFLLEELCQGFLSLSLFILATRVAQLINSDQCQTVTAVKSRACFVGSFQNDGRREIIHAAPTHFLPLRFSDHRLAFSVCLGVVSPGTNYLPLVIRTLQMRILDRIRFPFSKSESHVPGQ